MISFLSLGLALLYNSYILFFYPVLIVIILLKGLLGNTTPIVWAAVADTQSKDIRFALTLATAPYAIGYFVIGLFNTYLSENKAIIVVLAFYVLIILLCMIFFKDIRDKKPADTRAAHKSDHTFLRCLKLEGKQIVQELKESRLRAGLTTYLLWATSLYCILLRLVDFKNEFVKIVPPMMIGYLVGVVIMKFCKKISDDKMVKLGYVISMISLIIFLSTLLFVKDIEFILTFCYFFYSMDNAFLSPTILTLLSKDRQPHQQGKVFGFIESADSLGFLLGTMIILLAHYLKVDFMYLILFSFLTFAASWIPYSRYRKGIKEVF